MKLEIIATSLEDALKIEEGGANRIELVKDIKVGGLTPRISLIKKITKQVKIPVYVMLRPHSASFIYDEEDVKRILKDLKKIKKTKAKGIVFGALTKDNLIDEKLLKIIIENKGHLNLTFHRAIDESVDPVSAMKTLTKYKIERVLTSGGKKTALEGLETISKMTDLANKSNILILIGGGLNKENVKALLKKGKFNEMHFGSGVRFNRNNNNKIDVNIIKNIKALI